MEYPPWLPKPEHSRRGMLLALARCIYEMYYRPVTRNDGGEVFAFDTLCMGNLEQTAAVLQRAGFTRFLDEGGRLSVFNCGPHEFEEFAAAASTEAVSDAEIEAAVVRLAAGAMRPNLEVRKLADIVSEKSLGSG